MPDEQAIVLDAAVYKQKAVRAAARDYSHCADVNVEKDGRNLVVTLRNFPRELEDVIAFEFANYALWKLRE